MDTTTNTKTAVWPCLAFDDARAMIRTLGQRAVDMLPSERAETLRLLPELTTLID